MSRFPLRKKRLALEEDLETDFRNLSEAIPPAWSHPGDRNPFLSNAELSVLGLIAYGRTNKEIADALFIQQSTVRTHVKVIHLKSGVVGRSRLALAAYKIATGGDRRAAELLSRKGKT